MSYGSDTIIVGLGNPLRGDDAAGYRVADYLRKRASLSKCTIIAATAANLHLCELLSGFKQAVIVDAYLDPAREPGSIFWLSLDDLNDSSPSQAGHDLHISEIMKIGTRLGLRMPREVQLLAIAINGNTEWSESISNGVERGISLAATQLLSRIQPDLEI